MLSVVGVTASLSLYMGQFRPISGGFGLALAQAIQYLD